MAAEPVVISILRLPHAEGLPLPQQASAGSAGVDLRAAIDDPLTVSVGDRVQLPTGLILELPIGWEGQVRPRSGLAWRHGITLLNSPGTIDSDYRGELRVILANLGREDFVVRRGDRIAQLVVAPVSRVAFVESELLGETDRGAKGFGSSGVD